MADTHQEDYYSTPAPPPPGSFLWAYAPAFIVFACIMFNFVLCFVNTNFFFISVPTIVACEMILVGAALAYSSSKIEQQKIFWIAILAMQLVLILLMSWVKGEVLAKPLRDIMIMPVFILLGMSAYRMRMSGFLFGTTIIVLIVAFCEAFAPESFLSVFNFKNYFITKGALPSDAITPLDTFVSGTRPGGRFLIDIDIHRIASVFLEPVSLGFYGFLIALFFLSVKQGVSKLTYYGSITMCVGLIWLSDARMAMGALVLTLLMRPMTQKIDHRFNLVVAPTIFFIGFFLNYFNVLEKKGEGIGYRVYSTMRSIHEMTFEKFIGAENFRYWNMDSAYVDLMQNQGIWGLLLYWLPPLLFLKKPSYEMRVFLFGMSLFVAFGFMLSVAIFTIKIAALLWFCYGYIFSRGLYADRYDLARKF